MSGGYVTVAVLIQLESIPFLEVDLPCWQGLLYRTRELLMRLQWGCNEVLTSLGAYTINKRPKQGLFEIKVVEAINGTLELLVILQ